MSDTYIPRGEGRRQVARSRLFNIDNGAGATLDDVLLRHSQPISIRVARAVYATETAGTVAGANVMLGTTVGGNELVAATAYENGKTVGLATALTLKAAAAFVAANTPITARHTGIASTALGEVYVEVEYIVYA
jgi:hypothetical protein